MKLRQGMLRNISHIIYDLDGLLLDTEVIYAKAAAKVCALYGCEYDVTLKPKLIGRPAKESASDFVKWTNLPISPKTFLAERQTFLQDLLSQGSLMPGVLEITQKFLQLNIPQAIATNSTRKLFNLKTKNHREWFDGIFVTAVKSDDAGVENCKPAP
ncbi:MAG: HAD hydrolase-like protein, partial [bacterium]|nr:HAD hydrolase-like protein [bacterium]